MYVVMDDLSHLPGPDRAKRYRQLAADARHEAKRTKDAVRESYLIVAGQFDHLAVLADADMPHPG
jgi:hypothetical protein